MQHEPRWAAERAYELWVASGKPGKGAEEFWLQAERELAVQNDAGERAESATDQTLKHSFPARDPPGSGP